MFATLRSQYKIEIEKTTQKRSGDKTYSLWFCQLLHKIILAPQSQLAIFNNEIVTWPAQGQ